MPSSAGTPAGTAPAVNGTGSSPSVATLTLTPESVRVLKEKVASARASAQKRDELKKRLAAKKEAHATKQRASGSVSETSHATSPCQDDAEQKKAPTSQRKRTSGVSTPSSGPMPAPTDQPKRKLGPATDRKRTPKVSASSNSKLAPRESPNLQTVAIQKRRGQNQTPSHSSTMSSESSPARGAGNLLASRRHQASGLLKGKSTNAKRAPIRLQARCRRTTKSSNDSSGSMTVEDKAPSARGSATKRRRVQSVSPSCMRPLRPQPRGQLRSRDQSPACSIRRRRVRGPGLASAAALVSQHLRPSRTTRL